MKQDTSNRLLRKLFPRIIADQSGLTLIEILAAMTVFLVVSVGVAATFTSGLKTTAHTRLATKAKAQAQQQIEEMRALPFHVPYSVDPDIGTTNDVDILDYYFPNLNQSVVTYSQGSHQGWQGWYAPTTGTYTSQSPADDQGIVRTVEARFIDNDGITVILPTAFDTNAEGDDVPPSQLVEISITTSWAGGVGGNSFTVVSRVSSTNDYQGCRSNSNSHIDVISGLFSVSTGFAEPYTSFLSGNFGEGHGRVNTGCEVSTQGRGIGGTSSLAGGGTYVGAYANVVGPPNDVQSASSISVGTAPVWPFVTISSSSASAETVVADELGGNISSGGGATVVGMKEEIQQVDGWPGSLVDGYRQWDFINPVVEVVGVSGAPNMATLQQLFDVTRGEGDAVVDQVNILPLEAKSSNTPSATQGLIFIRGFTTSVSSQATGNAGGASNQITYSATVGIFDPSSPAGCVGDACYDIYAVIDAGTNPLQIAINLSSSNYRLQNAIFTEFHSYTNDEINAASYAAADGKTATVTIDALVKVSARFGTEVRWNTANDEITLIDPQGIEQVWLGSLDVALFQGT